MKSQHEIPEWYHEFDGPITVCDEKGIIVYMNEQSVRQFAKYGGEKLLGQNLLDCHPEPAKSKLAEMLEKPYSNIYTNSKNGEETMVIQKPWTQKGKFKGLVEISFKLPENLKCFRHD